jgi:hypothetical protein
MATPISEIHALDEILATGKSDADATVVVATLMAALDNPAWPEELRPQIAEIRQAAEALQAALGTGDMTTAATLAAPLHELEHQH